MKTIYKLWKQLTFFTFHDFTYKLETYKWNQLRPNNTDTGLHQEVMIFVLIKTEQNKCINTFINQWDNARTTEVDEIKYIFCL